MADAVRFSKEFYSRDAIDEAVADWDEVGVFTVGDDAADGAHIVVALESVKDADGMDAADLLGEFSNYVLGVEVGRRRS